MHYNVSSQILSKANNCYYAFLDSNLHLQSANPKLRELYKKENIGSETFLNLFAESYKQQWKDVFDHIDHAKESLETIMIPVITAQGNIYIDWNVSAVLSNNNTITGFEILGVESQKLKYEEEITANRAALATQETRFKLVLDKLKKALNSSTDIICTINEDGKFTRLNEATKLILGYEPREMLGKNFMDFIYPEDFKPAIKVYLKIKNGFGTSDFENKYYKKDGTVVSLEWSAKWDETDKKIYCIARDITQRKASEAALKVSEEKYKMLFHQHPLPMFIHEIDSLKFLELNEAAVIHYGFSRNEFLNMSVLDILADKAAENSKNIYLKTKPVSAYKEIGEHQKKNNETFYAEITSGLIDFEGKKAKIILVKDQTKKLLEEHEKLIFLSQQAFDAIWDWDLKTNEVKWNGGQKNLLGLADPLFMNKVDWGLKNLHPDDRERVETKLNKCLAEHTSGWEDEYRFNVGNNNYKYIHDRGYILYDDNNQPIRMIGAIQDLSETKAHENILQQLNTSLEIRARELLESNAELERFAYVASHDLQEPLRMVSSFLQLLEKRYKDKLDQKAHEYIAYAVDGAERMKRLILDLLEYSRVNSSISEKEDVDVNRIIDDLRITYKNVLKETDGTISNEQLPLVRGNKTQILQLFQNLIGNAFKYRSNNPPVINISYEEDNNAYKFAVTDNGLGIDSKFFDKIFIIFQRLHNREQYSGTGIGLAICKKIIDKHGGEIGVTSTHGEGSSFYFTLPKYK